MSIQNVPEIFIESNVEGIDLFVYDFKMTDDVFKSKVDLSMHMFSFLQKGKKHVHFADSSVVVDADQSLLIKKGNSLWSEMLDNNDIYFCKLLFFNNNKLQEFLDKYSKLNQTENEAPSCFVIQNDDYILSYLETLNEAANLPQNFETKMLAIKFEELMLYLMNKYGIPFEKYLHSLVSQEASSFKSIIEKNVYSNLKMEEIAFLCHMSLSTFKRTFLKEYKQSPGHWFQDQRLLKARELLESGGKKPTDIYMEFGYRNLSNFSAAFKNKFGKSPNFLQP